VALVLGPALVVCVLAARVWSGRPVAAVLLAVVAGSSLALFAVLTKGVVEVLEEGWGAVVRAPEFYPWLVVALCGMIFQQSAFRAGALTASLPTMTVAKPVVAGVLGITVLGETLEAQGPAAIVLVSAVAMVARGEAASMAAGTGRDVKTTVSHVSLAGGDAGQGDAVAAQDAPLGGVLPAEGVSPAAPEIA